MFYIGEKVAELFFSKGIQFSFFLLFLEYYNGNSAHVNLYPIMLICWVFESLFLFLGVSQSIGI